jgi:NAD(P)-dependent dehydrogenase (short-subunit alcohol dehydrogenase family)
VIDEISDANDNPALRFLALDLADLSSVKACAQAFLSTGEPLHCLINNAGVPRATRENGERLRARVRHQLRRPVPAHRAAARSASG